MNQEEVTLYDTVEAMLIYGGAFVRKLGEAYRAADGINQQKLIAAFPAYFKEYREMARSRKQQ